VGRLLWAEFQRLVAGLREVNPVWDTRRLEQVKGQAFKNFYTFSRFQIKGSYSFRDKKWCVKKYQVMPMKWFGSGIIILAVAQ
jgi:hypothetical protein